MNRSVAILAVALLFAAVTVSVSAENGLTLQEFKKLNFDQKPGAQIPADLVFRDDDNRTVTLGNCTGGKPAILALGYYECPMLCNLVLNGIVEAIQEIKPEADSGVHVVFVSINPKETPALATVKKSNYLKRLNRPGQTGRWHFLTGDPASIDKLARAAGFRYAWDPEHQQYAHPSGILILTPTCKISRYFFGVSYPADELRKALAIAAKEESSSRVHQFLLLCSQFIPLTGKFSGTIMSAVRAIAILTLLGVAGLILMSGRKRNPVSAGNVKTSEPALDGRNR